MWVNKIINIGGKCILFLMQNYNEMKKILVGLIFRALLCVLSS